MTDTANAGVSRNPLPVYPELADGAAYPLAVGGRVYLNPNDISGSTFVVTQADVTFNMSNHIDGTQQVNLMLVLERRLPDDSA